MMILVTPGEIASTAGGDAVKGVSVRSAASALATSLVWFVLVASSRDLAAQGLPLDVVCGHAGRIYTAESGVRRVSDLPFESRRGMGHIGGRAGRWVAATGRTATGAEPAWFLRGGDRGRPLTWRQGEFRYSFRVPRGRYLVELGLVETEVAAPGARVFDVLAENDEALRDVDIFAAAGDFAWLERSFEVGVFDGWLDLRFVAVTDAHPPRVSSIAIRPHEPVDGTPPSPAAPRLVGRAVPLANVLDVAPAAGGAFADDVIGYGVFRSEQREGPYDSLTATPLGTPFFVDRQIASGTTYFYRGRVYGAAGGQSALSEPVAIRAENLRRGGLPEYDLRLGADALRRIAVLEIPPAVAPGEVSHLGRVFLADIGLDTRPDRWHRRKSWRVDTTKDRVRTLGKRPIVHWSAEAGDFTLLRERLSATAAGVLGLASPRVQPVVVHVNGQLQGLRFDIEALDSKFRKRTRLDRVGLLARATRDDHWRDDWTPGGIRIGKAGDITALTRLTQALSRLHEGEIERFLEERFYLDRLIDRLAFAAVRGELDLPFDERYLLRDSRNGKWELLQQHYRYGDWGIVDGSATIHGLDRDAALRVLFPRTLRRGARMRSGWSVLLTRFFGVDRFRTRYLDRVEALLAGPLSSDAVEAMAHELWSEIRDAAAAEIELWPYDGGASFLRGPDAIAAGHRRRTAALRAAIREARREIAEPVVIEELSLRPDSGPAWVRLRNRSDAPVSLGAYRLGTSFDRPGRVVSADGTLGPGARLQVALGKAASSRSAGGQIVLTRRAGRTAAQSVLADFAFYGHWSAGVVSRRSAFQPGGWEFVRSGVDAPLAPPGSEYRHAVEERQSGDIEISFRVSGERDGPAKTARVWLHFRESSGGASKGDHAFERVPLVWDDERYRWAIVLEKSDDRPRTEYYFAVESQSGLSRTYPLGAPRVALWLPVRPDIVVNEVCPRPGEGPDAPGEFVELYNRSDQPVPLRGFYLTDDRRRATKWRITEDIVMPPRGYVVFYADGLDRGRHTSFKLSNSGEFVGLFGPPEEGSLRIDAMAFRGVPLGQSWGRRQDGTRSFRAWKHPTPGKRNVPHVPQEVLDKLRRESEQKKAESKSGDGAAE